MSIALLEESELRRIIREELEALLREVSRTPNDDGLPPTLTVEHAAKALRVGKSKMYDMTRCKGFPALRDGHRIMIPRDALFRWFEEHALANTGKSCRESAKQSPA